MKNIMDYSKAKDTNSLVGMDLLPFLFKLILIKLNYDHGSHQ